MDVSYPLGAAAMHEISITNAVSIDLAAPPMFHSHTHREYPGDHKQVSGIGFWLTREVTKRKHDKFFTKFVHC
jgi:hypothetical protein